MSSATSLVLADLGGALLTAAAEVAENSLFALADTCDQATFDAAARPAASGAASDDWVAASVGFSGVIVGRFELELSEPLARHLSASFAGADSEADIGDGDLLDFTGELANIMCGTWLTRASRHETFTLAAPVVGRQRPDLDPPAGGTQRHYFSIDDVPVRLTLHFAGVTAAGEASDGR